MWWYLNISAHVTLSRLIVVSSLVSNLSTHNDVMARTSPTWTHGAWTHAHATNQKSDGYAELTTMQKVRNICLNAIANICHHARFSIIFKRQKL